MKRFHLSLSMGRTYCGKCGKCTYDGSIEDSYQPCTCNKTIIQKGIGDQKKFRTLFIAGTIAGFVFGLCLALVLIKSIVCSS